MAHRSTLVTTLVCALLTPGASSTAQTLGATTGALNGRVTDRTGALLPGVVVVASGDTVMGTRTAVTDARGSFEVPALPPGDVTLVLSLSGFRTQTRDGVRVYLGETVTVDVVLDLAATGEPVVVSGRSPVIDRSGTRIARGLDVELLANVPGSRGISTIVSATPGVQLTRFDVGGNAAVEPGPYGAYGTNAPGHPTIEGISIQGHDPLGFTLDYGSLEHVAVGLGAFGPESPWPGVQLQFVTKSGGNRHHGSAYLDYENRRWQSFNIDQDQVQRRAPAGIGLPAREANRLWAYHDANVDAGGPLRKDRLWWYLSLRAQETSAKQVSFPVKPLRTDIVTVGGKATAQARGNNRFVVFGQVTRNRQPYRLGGFLRPTASVNDHEDSTTRGDAQGGVWKAEWNSIAGQKLFFELLAGQFIAGRRERPNGSSPRFEDTTASLPVLGGNRDWTEARRIDQLVASVIRGPMGRHHLKLGGGVERVLFTERWYRGYVDDVLHVTQNSLPLEVYLFQTPSASKAGLQWYSAYVNDSWRATDRLTINLGFRFDRHRAFLPAQEHPARQSSNRSWARQAFAAENNLIDWNVVAPRLGVSRDLTGNGRTLLKATYGRYWLPPGPDLLFNANPNSRVWWERSRWIDADADSLWDPGEDAQLLDRRGGIEVESIDEGLQLPFVHEVTARIEREIAANTRVETGVVWRGHRQPFLRQDVSHRFSAFSRAVPVPDPGVDGLRGTADDGPPIVVYDVAETLTLPSYRVANVPNALSDHVTWEVTANRRLRGRWSLVAGFSHTWAREQASGYSGQAVRANPYPLTPNDLIHTDDEGRHGFRAWTARASGTWEGPSALRITPFLRHQSGQPYGRTFLVGGLNMGPLRVLAEPIGTRRMDNITLVDLRVEKAFPIERDRRISTFFDVYNLLNANPELNVNWSSDRADTFGSPIAIVPPRIARVGMKVAW